MKRIFVDTSAWVAVANRRDQHHVTAANFYKEIFKEFDELLTTNLVVSETYILLRLDCGLDVALSWWERIASSLKVKIIYADPDLTEEAISILRRYDDQHFSLTDAVSFALMKKTKITDAFAFDVHFAIAGFLQSPQKA
ncbi:MAG: 23S rRNA-specific endonuclease VapC20 [Syntrophomonadaceae bacterium]|nr:23S rRNA-specific endonuclease VapC20 [Bacillota bacterium]